MRNHGIMSSGPICTWSEFDMETEVNRKFLLCYSFEEMNNINRL